MTVLSSSDARRSGLAVLAALALISVPGAALSAQQGGEMLVDEDDVSRDEGSREAVNEGASKSGAFVLAASS